MAQTITWSSGDNANTSIYLFNDDEIVEIGADQSTIKDANGNPTLIISDVNSSNATLHTGVDTPDDYFGYKYSYNETDGWVAIEGWIDPRLEENNGE
jgi:hypothetical protein